MYNLKNLICSLIYKILKLQREKTGEMILQESGTAAGAKVRMGIGKGTMIDLMNQKVKEEGIVTVRRVEAERGKIMTGIEVEREKGIGEDE